MNGKIAWINYIIYKRNKSISATLLIFETATEACSVALSYRDCIFERYQFVLQKHSELILPMAHALLAESGVTLANLDALVLNRGPGSFTGVRLASSVIQAIALAFDLPVILISSLQNLAQAVYHAHGVTHVLAALDARMQQIYWSNFILDSQQHMQAQAEESVIAPETIVLSQSDQTCIWVGAGSGWDRYHDALSFALTDRVCRWIPDCYPKASASVVLAQRQYDQGNFVSAQNALPVYVRDEIAKKSGKCTHG